MDYFNERINVRVILASIYRWRIREVPHQVRGNTNFVMIRGLDLFHLIIYRMILPKATADKIMRFIFDINALGPRIYSRVSILRVESILEMTRKCSSTVALQAFEWS